MFDLIKQNYFKLQLDTLKEFKSRRNLLVSMPFLTGGLLQAFHFGRHATVKLRFYALSNGRSVATQQERCTGMSQYSFYALSNGRSVATGNPIIFPEVKYVSMPFLTGGLLQQGYAEALAKNILVSMPFLTGGLLQQ